MFYVKWTLLVAIATLGCALATTPAAGDEGSSGDNSASKPADLKAQVADILQHRCGPCHKSAQRLMARVDPKAGTKNRLYVDSSTPHPKKNPKVRCNEAELKTIAQWLESLAQADSQPTSEPANK